jgi:hypothetical protein
MTPHYCTFFMQQKVLICYLLVVKRRGSYSLLRLMCILSGKTWGECVLLSTAAEMLIHHVHQCYQVHM